MTITRAMTTSELRAELSLRGVDLWVAGDRLRYRARKGALTSDLLEELSRNKSELMALLRDGNERAPAFYPLSYGQRALWFLHKLAPESAAYNAIFAARIRADVDPAALKRAFESLIERHAILRTTYIESAGDSAVQQVHQNIDFDIPSIDASGWSQAELNERIIEAAHQPFNLEQGPVWRGVLFALSPQESIFLLAVHHIAIDVLSYAVLISELCLLYSAENSGVTAALPPPRAVYSDYVRWHTEMLSSAEGERLWTYWQQQLSGELPELNLPTDHIRPPVQTYQGSSHTFVINKELTQAIRALAEKEGVTLYTTLLAAFQTLLYRYTGQEDILIGCPTGGRSRADFESIVGYFVNPLVLRGDLSGDPTFTQYLARTYRVVRDALAHQDFPFPLLVERLRPVRDPSRSPLFQVTFTLDKLHQLENLSEFVLGLKGTSVEIGRLELETVAVPEQEGQFDLDLLIVDTGSQLSASLKYNTELFEAATIRRMGSQFLTLLEAVVAEPELRLSELPLLSVEEQELLREWNDTATEFSGPRTVDGLSAAQADRTPTAIAVECQGEKVSYAELNSRANQLARYLRQQGVGSGVLVGILLERSVDVVVALLGVLKTGAAYVPLDVSHPAERIELMVKDAGIAVVLTQEREAGVLSTAVQDGSGVRVINLDKERKAIGGESEAKIEEREEAAGAELAYVIYTSGSTGRPKGVMVSHSAVVNLLASMQRQPGLTEQDVFVGVTTLSFDIAALEIFLPLMVGARLVLASREVASDGVQLAALLSDCGATAMQATPATWRLLLEAGWKGDPRLKIICGGEALPEELALRLLKLGSELWNMYGPTETTIWSACDKVEEDNRICIGQPISNTELYVLDKHLKPAPVNVIGELYIGGTGLARGYFKQPGPTAEKFIPNPFSVEPGLRLYRTNDLARYLPDGNIVFLGRTDHQVKIRGYRIELGEIEATLLQHPVVRETVVTAVKTPRGENQLVAYVVAQDGAATVNGVRDFLAQKLPAYMLPSVFVHLEALPLTPNAKIDRKALPLPEQAQFEKVCREYVAPRTAVEEILAQTWAEVIGVDRVGIHDNFFEIGGHSLLAAQVISRVRKTFKTDLPLHYFFESPTVTQLAERVEAATRASLPLRLPPLKSMPRTDEIPLSFAQQRLWVLEQLAPGNPVYNIPMAMRLKGKLDRTALQLSFSEILKRHENLRTVFQGMNGNPLQRVTTNTDFAIPTVDLSKLPAEEREGRMLEIAFQEGRKPFDLSRGPLLRACLLVLDTDEYVLLVTMHHIVSDDWSIQILVREMSSLYESITSGKPSTLPPLPIQYADFALWQRELSKESVLEDELVYWKQQLSGVSPMLELPSDHPRPPMPTFRGACQSFTFPESLGDGLRTLSHRQGVTLFMTLLAGFQVLLHQCTKQEDIAIVTPVANRDQSDTEGVIGFFLNMLCLRTDLGGDPTFLELIARVRDTALAAYSHQHVSFEKVVEEVQPKREPGRTPLSQLMFTLHRVFDEKRKLSELVIEPLDIHSGTAKFDISLLVEERDDALSAVWEYNTELFEEATIRRMGSQLLTLLKAVVTEPGLHLSELPLLSAEEQQLLREWNDTRVEFSGPRTVDGLITAQAERTPTSTAVECHGEKLSYAELNRRANQLARYLRRQRVGPGVLVGILLERSVDVVVALLGVLKAGAAYVPLEVSHPAERIELMVKDAGVAVVLTQERVAGVLSTAVQDGSGVRVINLDQEREAIGSESEAKIEEREEAAGAELAYVIYTSGSTGRPKGVMVSHSAVVNLLNSMRQHVSISEKDVLLAVTTMSFDIAGLEMFLPLTVGARLVIYAEPVFDGLKLSQSLTNSAATIMQAVPVTWQLLLRSGWPGNPDLKALCGGDSLSQDLANMLREKCGTVWNVYGPTETTIWSTIYRVEGPQKTVSIGCPLANTQLHLLDSHLRPVPVGVAGELYIGGDGLARGYMNRPDLTADRFIPNPMDGERGGRLYRTGDLARYRRDGNIEFLGRLDHQVKLQGFRIELGEIETVLRQHPKIRETVVVPRNGPVGERQLVAYIVAEDEPPTVLELRHFLAQKLPAYMVPSAFVHVEAWPLTPNGKIDRKALPAPDFTRPHREESYVAPRNTMEEILAQTCAQILNVERVGIYDNFFELGGASLASVEITAVLNQAGIPLTPEMLFEYQTIAQLAEALTKRL